jgi:hypothetical protein
MRNRDQRDLAGNPGHWGLERNAARNIAEREVVGWAMSRAADDVA